MKQIYALLFCLFLSMSANAQDIDREFRAFWVATVFNIDWPSVKNNPDRQKAELIAILDSAKQVNANAILLQIRPNADALYASSKEPWSEWLTGVRGQDPGYDPLAFAIEQGHAMGIEVHGWINPYRFETESGRYSGKPGDYRSSHEDWILDVDGKTYFDPGNPQVTTYIQEIVGEIVQNYDLDGLCFDDYFYPSGISNEDNDSYQAHRMEGEAVGDFRRRSVNEMIAAVYDTIQRVKPWVRFGVSPAGIYSMDPNAAAKHGTTLPSGIVGRDNYHQIYCDPLAWIEQGVVDYISPQLYWAIGGGQDYKTLLDWWSAEANKYGVACFPSLGSYRLSRKQPVENPSDGWANTEIIDQIKHTRTQRDQGANGIIFYKQSDIEQVTAFSQELKSQVYQQYAISPEFSSSMPPQIIVNGRLEQLEDQPTAAFQWDDENNQKYYVEFLNQREEQIWQRTIYTSNVTLPLDTLTTQAKIYSLNRWGAMNDQWVQLSVEPTEPAQQLTPEQQIVASHDTLKWKYTENASAYQVEVSVDSSFQEIYYASGLQRDTQILVQSLDLEGEMEYFWRVKSCNGLGCYYSPTQKISPGFPTSIEITAPLMAQTHVPLEAEIRWTQEPSASSYDLEISSDSLFQNIVVRTQVDSTEHFETPKLHKWTRYYVRVRAKNSFGNGPWSSIVSFVTTTDIPLPPMFLEPEPQAQIEDSIVTISWEKMDFATGYHVEIALDELFQNVITDTVMSSYVRKLTIPIEVNQTYYARVCGTYIGGCGGWSETLQFSQVISSSYYPEPKILALYPNPVNEVLYLTNGIDYLQTHHIARMEIFNIVGQKVQTNTIYGNRVPNQIAVDSLRSGMYFIKFSDLKGQVQAVARFVRH